MLRPMDLWRCAIVRQTPGDILRDGLDKASLHWLPELPHGQFQADPFGLWLDGRLHVFVEAFDYQQRVGHIDVLVFDSDLALLDHRTVLTRPWHLSYPVVFEAEGAIWMLPEAFQSGTLTLYRAERFPFDWQPISNLPLDGPAIDATPVFRDGLWWLFYTPSRDKTARRTHLHVAFAERLCGPWQMHPANPVLVDAGGARPGGMPFEQEGRLVLPVQDCRATYGHAIRALEIERLDRTGFAVSHQQRLTAADWMAPYTDGLHTLSAAGPVTLIDAKRMDASLRGKTARLAGIVRRRLRKPS